MIFRKIIETHKAPAAVGTYSQGVEHNDVIYYSGQIGIHPTTGELASGFENQLTQIMANIDGLLEASNLERKNIIKTAIYLVDLAEFAKINKTYEEYFEQPFPARSCIQAAALPKGALVEIEVIAAK